MKRMEVAAHGEKTEGEEEGSVGNKQPPALKKVAVEWPRGFVGEELVMSTLRRLGGDERRKYHTKWLVGSVLGMPISAPVALVPM